jgi:hypothetical protein
MQWWRLNRVHLCGGCQCERGTNHASVRSACGVCIQPVTTVAVVGSMSVRRAMASTGADAIAATSTAYTTAHCHVDEHIPHTSEKVCRNNAAASKQRSSCHAQFALQQIRKYDAHADKLALSAACCWSAWALACARWCPPVNAALNRPISNPLCLILILHPSSMQAIHCTLQNFSTAAAG